MKHKTHHMYYLFYPRSWMIIIAWLLYSITVSAQETPAGEDKFYIGAEFHNQTIENTIFYDPFDTSGMNTISQRADIMSTWSYIKDYNILAGNVQYKTDWIAHYTTCYYSKWEAEENQADEARVGVKHKWGQQAFWNDTVSCWSTIGITDPKNSIMFGPHYRQDKRYKRWLYDTCYNQPGCLSYTPRFRMALDNHGGANSDEDVCIIKVVFSYRYENTYPQDTTFIQRTLKVRDFDNSGGFDDFYLDPNTFLGRYEYPPEFSLPMKFLVAEGVPSPVDYIDSESFTGIQFCVDWLRDDTLCTLYIDYVEVYDNNGWNEFIQSPQQVIDNITLYAQNYNNENWQNIRYWLGVDEPYSIDCYTPIRVVDELVRSVNPNTPLVVPFNPTWSWDNYEINGEDEVSMFYNIAKPKRITLSNNPCHEDYPTIRYEDFEFLRFNLQRTSALDSNFWFNVQTEGYRTNYNEPNEDPEWCIWRKPQSAELRVRVENLINIRKKLQEKFSKGEFLSKPVEKKLKTIDEKFLAKVLEVIEKHISEEEFSIEECSSEVGFSRTHFHKKLRALVGKSPSQYVRTVRLYRAKQMIEEEKGNVSEVAYSVGFSSPAYFSRCFKEEFGYPPSDILT